MLALILLSIFRCLARERLRFILLAAQEFRRLLLVTILDLSPLSAGALGCGLRTLLLFLQMLALERLRFRVMLALKLFQLRGAIALALLLLLDAFAFELLHLDVVLALERLRLHAVLAFYRFAHRVAPVGMTLQRHCGIFLRPPVDVVPDVLVVVIA